MMASREWREVCRATAFVAVCAALACAVPAEVSAQASQLGGTITVAQGSIRYADIGYDPVNNVYLVVSGAERVQARFVSASGTVLGNVAGVPDVVSGAYAPRVVYSPDIGGVGGFLVTWLDLRLDPRAQQTHVRGRMVRFDPTSGQVVLMSPDFFISAAPGGAGAESAAVAAYSPTSKEFLVAWRQGDGRANLFDIHAQRVDLLGNLLGGDLTLTYDVHWQTTPAIAHDPLSNSFLVVWSNFTEPKGPGGVQARRVDAGTGVLAPTVQVFTGLEGYTPDVTLIPNTGNYLITYFNATVHYGLRVDASGVTIAGAAPMPLLAGSKSYNGWSVDFSPVSNSFFAVLHGSAAEDWGIEFDVNGISTGLITATSTGVKEGNYNPRVAARTGGTAAEWMLAVQTSDLKPTSLVTAQLITSPTRNPAPGGGEPPPPAPTPIPVTDASAIDWNSAPNGAQFFPEGNATSDGTYDFNTYYELINVNSVDANVRAYFAKQTSDGSVVLKEANFVVKANERRTIDLKGLNLPGAWSAVFQSQTLFVPVQVQQSLYWGQGLEGSSGEKGVSGTSAVWFFAEGTRKANDFFATFFQLFNPLTTPLVVRGEYYTDGSSQPITREYTLPPSSRFTVWANQVPELADKDFSTAFRAVDGQSGFVAQRSMFWGPGYAGGHTSIGVTGADDEWQFAEGAAFDNFDTYYLLLNTNPYDIAVTVSYLTRDGFVARPDGLVIVRANSRTNVHLNSDLGNVGAVAATFKSTDGSPFVVERSIYWGGGFPNWVEGTNVFGVTDPSMSWRVPDGSDAPLVDSYLLIANPNTIPVEVMVRFYVEGKGRYTPPAPLIIPALTRATIDMSNPSLLGFTEADLTALKGQSFGVSVDSHTANGPVIVEQAVYRNLQPGVFWRAGSSAFGIPIIP